MSLTLHYHPLSSFSWKVLVALYENGSPCAPNLLNPGDPGQHATFLKLWPIGRFPVLHDEARNETVPESTIIIEYLDRHYPGRTTLIPAEPELALKTRLRDRFLDLYVHLPVQKIVTDRLRPAGARDPHGVQEARAQLRTSYDLIEQQMAQGQDHGSWTMGEAFTLADCAAWPALFYGNMAEPFGSSRKHLSAYLERLKARPSVARVVAEAEPYFHMVPQET